MDGTVQVRVRAVGEGNGRNPLEIVRQELVLHPVYQVRRALLARGFPESGAMKSGQDDPTSTRNFRQVARRYFETEMVTLRQEAAEGRVEVERLRAVLDRIERSEPYSHDAAGLKDLVGSLQSIAREALSHTREGTNR